MAKPLSQIQVLALQIIKEIRSGKKKLLSPHLSPLILVSDHSSLDFFPPKALFLSIFVTRFQLSHSWKTSFLLLL